MGETMSPHVACPRGPRLSRICALLLLACTAAGIHPTASARASGLVVIPRPASGPGLSYFKLSLRPARARTAGAIVLRNPSARRLRVALAPVDARTIDTLGSTYAPVSARRLGWTRWLRIGRRAVSLGPGQSAVVPVSVRVPRTAQPGDYLSGISIEAQGQRASRVRRRGVPIASVVR